MKINRALPRLKRLHLVRGRLITLPFLLLGGVGLITRHRAGRFRIERVTLAFPQLPAAWQGMTITQLSDLHIGPGFTVKRHLPPVIDACRELASDLVVITGDFVDRHASYLPAALPLLRQLEAPLGTFACLGNHDVFNTRWEMIRLLRSWLGSNLLINQNVTLARGGSTLSLSGIDFSTHPNRLRRHIAALAQALRPPADFRIVLAHDPRLFPQLCELGADLVLSGHTHGGQLSLTAPPRPVIGPLMHTFPFLRGTYHAGSSALYVNRGLGQTMPLRLNNPTEITQITLVGAGLVM
ncbi:MAG: hypothetical protein B9S32_10095 [Verrucomicrobia bacterium Tous-C9LFEB]|nr:MAG: hypothetical protein B9S32_10095 [Verrucomicrobia bacterium Tous-C9LFEB]